MGSAVSDWHYLNEYLPELIGEMTGGRIEITMHPGGTLFPIKDTLDNVAAGVVDLSMIGGTVSTGKDPTFTAICFLTGGTINNQDDEAIYVYETDYIDIVSDLYAKYGVKWLAVGYFPEEQFLSTVPIRSLEDYKGLKIRASGTSELLFDAMGAESVAIATPEIYTALQLGTVDAADAGGAGGNWDMSLHEVTKYIIEPCFHLGIAKMDYIMTLDTWNSLTPELQAIVQAAARITGERFGIKIKAKNKAYRQDMIDYGLEVITLPESALLIIHEAALKVWDDVAAISPEAAILVQQYRDVCRLVGKPME